MLFERFPKEGDHYSVGRRAKISSHRRGALATQLPTSPHVLNV